MSDGHLQEIVTVALWNELPSNHSSTLGIAMAPPTCLAAIIRMANSVPLTEQDVLDDLLNQPNGH